MKRDTNFYYSFLVLPREKREAIIAVWDFFRAVDDVADEAPAPGVDPAAELGRWRAEVAAMFSDRTPETRQGASLKPFVSRFGLPREAFEAVVDGVEMDLSHDRYPTFEALREYCLKVASAVGLACLEIFGYRDGRARDYAVDLGLALQLTNIARDVAGDLARGRIYLPQEDLERCGCAEADLRAGVVTEPVRAVMRYHCDRARQYYAKAARELPRVDRRSLVAARIMGAIYFDILRRIERRGYDVFSDKVRVPRRRKVLLAAATWAGAMAGL